MDTIQLTVISMLLNLMGNNNAISMLITAVVSCFFSEYVMLHNLQKG